MNLVSFVFNFIYNGITMAKDDIPNKISLSASDPFLQYLAHMHNSGVDYLAQSKSMLSDVGEYQDNLDDYMKNNKLQFLLGENKK